MKTQTLIATLLSLLLAVSSMASEQDVVGTTNLASLPMTFTQNQGQWNENVSFRADANGATMWFTGDGTYFQLTKRIESGEDDIIKTMMIKAAFIGANTNARTVGEQPMRHKSNFIFGSDPSQWHTCVANFGSIRYREIYPGIDLKYYSNGTEMEYDFLVAAGADISRIRIQYQGVESIAPSSNGELIIETDWGTMIERKPVVYQVVNNSRIPVEASYSLKGDNSFGFDVTGAYRRNLPLVIDPVLAYGTYLGGSGGEFTEDITVDNSGCAYVTGSTSSSDFPTENPFQTDQPSTDVFLTKIDISGNVIYSTYLGGNGFDAGNGIAMDDQGCVYIAGTTVSTDFPTVNPYQTLQGRSDIFVTKLNSSGSGLIYSTYLGGSDWDEFPEIAVDGLGHAYVTGSTVSDDYPTKDAYQTTLRDTSDAFVTKLNTSGNDLVFSTYLGGDRADFGHSITVDQSGCAYIAGSTQSGDFPTVNALQPDMKGLGDAFVTKLTSAGDNLVYSTFLGGSEGESGQDISVDNAGCLYIAGLTSSGDFPLENPYQIYQGEWDAFVTKLSGSGESLIYSTYIGGSGDDRCGGISVDDSGCAYIAGRTMSYDFPTEFAYQDTFQGYEDAFVVKLSSTGSAAVYSTYLGGTYFDRGFDVAVDASGAAWVTGHTYSTDFPTENPYQTYQDGADVFVAKLIAKKGSENQPDTTQRQIRNQPNPFNPSTTIYFSLKSAADVDLSVYDILGRKVAGLHSGRLPAGDHQLVWSGTNDAGQKVSSGVYLCRLKHGNKIETNKMVLMK